jgi:hypothetical protein
MSVIKTALFKAIRRLLDSRGYRITPEEIYWVNQAQYIEIDGDYLDAIYCTQFGNQEPLFSVDISIVRSPLGFGYSPACWDAYTATLQQYKTLGDQLKYEDTILNAFYKRYQPATSADVYLLEKRGNLLQAHLPRSGHVCFALPWFHTIPESLVNEHGQPVNPLLSYEKGIREFHKTINLYKSIAEHGYVAELHRGDHIRGYFLRKDDDYRFLITGGFHRMAVLGELGYQQVPVTFQLGYPRVINYDDIDKLRQVKNNNISYADAEKIFLFFFENDGTRIAKELGLVDYHLPAESD